MTHKILLESHIERWSVETIERYIFAQKKNSFSVISILTTEETNAIISRLKAQGLEMFENGVKQMLPISQHEQGKARCIRILLARFAFTSKPQDRYPIMDTEKNLIKNFELEDYQS